MNDSYKLAGMILMSFFSFLGLYFLKISLNQLIPEEGHTSAFLKTLPYLILQGKFWLALLGYGSALVVFLFLLQTEQASKVFTITVGFNILLTTLGAALFLGDTINAARAVGMLLIITGIFLIHEY